MKTTLHLLLLSTGLLVFAPACMVVKHDNGNHNGWYKNPNNPHNPATAKTSNPGHGNGNGKGKK